MTSTRRTYMEWAAVAIVTVCLLLWVAVWLIATYELGRMVLV